MRLKENKRHLFDTSVFMAFLIFSFLSFTLISPIVSSNAEAQTISETVGPYTMSMSNDTVASINITPTASQTVYTGTNNLTVRILVQMVQPLLSLQTQQPQTPLSVPVQIPELKKSQQPQPHL